MTPAVSRFLRAARVGHMATVDGAGNPSVVPICFQVRGARLYSVIDAKPKNSAPMGLRRVRNLLQNPRVAVVVDHYEEDWSRLGWVLLRGRGALLEPGREQREALALLREKYAQYRDMELVRAPVIRMEIESVSRWGSLAAAEMEGAG